MENNIMRLGISTLSLIVCSVGSIANAQVDSGIAGNATAGVAAQADSAVVGEAAQRARAAAATRLEQARRAAASRPNVGGQAAAGVGVGASASTQAGSASASTNVNARARVRTRPEVTRNDAPDDSSNDSPGVWARFWSWWGGRSAESDAPPTTEPEQPAPPAAEPDRTAARVGMRAEQETEARVQFGAVVRRRRAEIAHLRDQALESGNTELMARADQLEAELRAELEARRNAPRPRRPATPDAAGSAVNGTVEIESHSEGAIHVVSPQNASEPQPSEPQPENPESTDSEPAPECPE
jgi:hypothetical protein